MPRRPEQLAHALRDAVATFVAEELEFPDGVLVTVTRALVSGDERSATLFVSIYPDAQSDDALARLSAQLYDLQGRVNETLGHRRAPRIRFARDTGIARAARIEVLSRPSA